MNSSLLNTLDRYVASAVLALMFAGLPLGGVMLFVNTGVI